MVEQTSNVFQKFAKLYGISEHKHNWGWIVIGEVATALVVDGGGLVMVASVDVLVFILFILAN